MEEIEAVLQSAVRKADSSLGVQVERMFGEKRAAGFKIIDENGKKGCEY